MISTWYDKGEHHITHHVVIGTQPCGFDIVFDVEIDYAVLEDRYSGTIHWERGRYDTSSEIEDPDLNRDEVVAWVKDHMAKMTRG